LELILGAPLGELAAQPSEGFGKKFDEILFNPSVFGAIRRIHLLCKGCRRSSIYINRIHLKGYGYK